MRLSFAFCTYNRASRLERLVSAMRAQSCPLPFEILAINNNSTDATAEILAKLARRPGPPLRWVTEPVQGIVAARNRAIEEALQSDILVFIDDDEIPLPGLLEAACDAILNEGAECVGGCIELDFSETPRPAWLDEELAGFLGRLNHGEQPFWISTEATPVWSGVVAYATRLFRDDRGLRFDKRFDRVGNGVGGGEDAIMFRNLLARGARIRYRPDMAVLHAVEPWRLKRSYFLKLHYRAGLRKGEYLLPDFPRTVFRIPPFMVAQLMRQAARIVPLAISGKPGLLRQAMNAAHALGCLQGYRKRSAAKP